MYDDSLSRQQLRKQLIKQRKLQPSQRQQEKSAAMVKHLLRNNRYRAARHIAIYFPVNGEANPTALFLKHRLPRQHFYLPVLSSLRQGEMDFVPWTDATRFRRNQFNIPEPVYHLQQTQAANALDIVIMPMLGFDRQGHRLGMGGGYYDRTFAFKLNSDRRPFMIGFGYGFQQLDVLTSQAWDVPLQAWVTEEGWFTV